MADNKKYYYLKLKENFFDSDELILLESQKDGYLYSNILLKLYLRSLKNDGKLMFNDRIPYNAEILSTIVRHNVAVVEKALHLFAELGLIEILDNGAIYMLDIQNFIGTSSTEADRVRNYRNKIEAEKKNYLECTNVVHLYDKNTPEKEKEIEIEKELELDKEIKKEKKETLKSVLGGYSSNPDLITTLQDYIEMRKTQKGFTVKALKLNLNELDKLAVNDEMKIDIVNQTIANGWKGFYPLKSQKTQQKQEERAF